MKPTRPVSLFQINDQAACEVSHERQSAEYSVIETLNRRPVQYLGASAQTGSNVEWSCHQSGEFWPELLNLLPCHRALAFRVVFLLRTKPLDRFGISHVLEEQSAAARFQEAFYFHHADLQTDVMKDSESVDNIEGFTGKFGRIAAHEDRIDAVAHTA